MEPRGESVVEEINYSKILKTCISRFILGEGISKKNHLYNECFVLFISNCPTL